MRVKRSGTQRGKTLSSFTQNDVVFMTDDCVLINSGPSNLKPYIGRIKKIEQRARNNISIEVEWFYRPDESLCGRLPFHGDKEVFESDHVDRLPSHVIEDRCTVHTYEEYTELEVVKDNDFFYRWKYDPSTGEFTPDQVTVYCVCELPHNPDRSMIGCDQCKDWFHPECIGLTESEQVELESESSTFLCPSCLSKRMGQRSNQGNKRAKFEA
eukprot:g4694.t1